MPRDHRKSATYSTWRSMRTRCRNPEHDSFSYYGGRGIKVCPRWEWFRNFLSDMGDKPMGYSLDRIDVNGPYSKENCRWVCFATQAHNRRNTKLWWNRGGKIF